MDLETAMRLIYALTDQSSQQHKIAWNVVFRRLREADSLAAEVDELRFSLGIEDES